MDIHIGWPQGILVALYLIQVAVAISKHGTPREDWNGWGAACGAALTLTLLYWGGFFGGCK